MKSSSAAMILATVLTLVTTNACSQDMQVPAVTTADAGFLFPNDARAREADPGLNHERRMHRDKTGGQAVERDRSALKPSRAEVRARYDLLRPEFERRARTEGMTEAKRWLAEQAWEMGQHDGEAARRANR